MIVTDGDRVLQIITNLLANAFRWTPNGGRVEAPAELREREHPRRGRGHRARESARRSRTGSSARSGRTTARARASGSRSRASWRWRSAAGSTSTARSGAAASSSSSCRRSRSSWLRALRTGRSGRCRPCRACAPCGRGGVDAAPAGRDQVDEQREVVDARMPLGKEVGLERPRAGGSSVRRARAPRRAAVPTGAASVRTPSRTASSTTTWKRRLELARRALRQRLDLLSGPLEGRLDVALEARPLAAFSSRSRARAIAASSMGGTLAFASDEAIPARVLASA